LELNIAKVSKILSKLLGLFGAKNKVALLIQGRKQEQENFAGLNLLLRRISLTISYGSMQKKPFATSFLDVQKMVHSWIVWQP